MDHFGFVWPLRDTVGALEPCEYGQGKTPVPAQQNAANGGNIPLTAEAQHSPSEAKKHLTRRYSDKFSWFFVYVVGPSPNFT